MMEITKVVSAAKKEIKNLALGQSEIERKDGWMDGWIDEWMKI